MNVPAVLPEQIEVGDRLPSFSLPITRTRVCQGAAATLDWFGGHHDPDFARAQGLDDVYVNVMFNQGLVDRLIYGWAGPAATIRRRRIDMLLAVMAGRTATVAGTVTAVGDGGRTVEVEATIETADGTCVRATVTAALESRAQA